MMQVCGAIPGTQVAPVPGVRVLSCRVLLPVEALGPSPHAKGYAQGNLCIGKSAGLLRPVGPAFLR